MFSDQKVNSGRQVELDLMKCMSIVFMMCLHCWFMTSAFNNKVSIYMQRGIGQLLGEPFAAPVFMFAMGVGIVYSRNQDPTYLIKRGIKQMLLGLVVNVGEYIIPYYLAGYLLGEWGFPFAGGLVLFVVDILAFAGMAMILIGIFKKLNLTSVQMLGVALVMSVAGSLLRFRDFGSNIMNLITGYFIGSEGTNGRLTFTAFPLFNWILFPVVGIFFGEYYIRCKDKKKLLRAWPAGLLTGIVYFVASWYIPGGFLSNSHHYYFMTTIDVVFCLAAIYGVIGLWYFVSGFLPEGVLKFFSKMSGNLDIIYIVQWFLIPITYILIVFFYRDVVFGDLSLIVIALLEIAVCMVIATRYKKFKKNLRKEEIHDKKE